MATKKTTTKKTPVKAKRASSVQAQKVSAPRKITRKPARSATRSVAGGKDTEMNVSELNSSDAPQSKIITRKYLYAVVGVLVVIGLLFAASRLWVIAWVDNKPVTKFELYALLEKRDQGKTSEELIGEKLLESEGQKQRHTISEAEVEAEIKKVEEQQGGAEQLNQVLAANGTNYEDFRQLVKRQLLIQKLFGADINITEEDVDKYLEENKAALPPTILENPESSEAAKLRESVKEQLKWSKVSENYSKWMEEALKSSRVMKM